MEEAKRFDLLILRLQHARPGIDRGIERLRDPVRDRKCCSRSRRSRS